MKKLLEGNHAVSYGVMRARVQVIPVYPITPQTHISEALAEFVADGSLDAKYIKVESEHSAMAACIGASTAGARAFTATSSQGIALMHEMLHWASGARLPIVICCVNRTLGSPWNIWNDQSDSMSQRDTGWLQFYSEDNQEALDSVIMAFSISEKTFTPSMVILDAFIQSHTMEAVDVPEQKDVDEFLPPLKNPNAIDIDNPRAYSPVVSPDHFMEVKYKQFEAARDASSVINDVNRKFGDIFKRSYDHISPYHTGDADVVICAAGAVSGTVRTAVDELRCENIRAGMVKVRTFRPFPEVEIREILENVPNIGVIDKSVSIGSGGPLAQEIKAALYGLSDPPKVVSFIGGLGGRDITVDIVKETFLSILDGKKYPEGSIGPIFLGLKK
jgi:pyruvate/2-oxoacid:ferredoxin oxidoreductase alpha subunit